MRSIRLEIVIPVHNRRETTLRCLRSIERSRLDQITAHIIVIDDGSTDGTADAIAHDHPNVEIIAGSGDLWYTEGTNVGLRSALDRNPDYILAVNDDSIFDENCILRLVECAEENRRSVIGALLLDAETPHKVFQVSPKWQTTLGGFRHWRRQTVWTVPSRPWRVDLIVGNCVLYPAEAIRELGFMNSKRLVQYGDAEYTPRMRRNGWQLLIEPAARVFCEPNAPVSGFRSLSQREKFKAIFSKPTGPYSIRRRIFATLGGAPSTSSGIAAIGFFFIRVILGRNMEGRWGMDQPEPPLSEIFADSVIKDNALSSRSAAIDKTGQKA